VDRIMDLTKSQDRIRTLGCKPKWDARLMALERWYYLGIEDRVKCISCKGEIRAGRFGKGIIERHLDSFSWCDLARRRQGLREKLAKVGRDDKLFSSVGHVIEYPLATPAISVMSDAKARLETFEKSGIKGNYKEMVGAGLYWSWEPNKVRCYYCSGDLDTSKTVQNWQVQHARWHPQCEYINRCLGYEVIKEVQEYYGNPGLKMVEKRVDVTDRVPSAALTSCSEVTSLA